MAFKRSILARLRILGTFVEPPARSQPINHAVIRFSEHIELRRSSRPRHWNRFPALFKFRGLHVTRSLMPWQNGDPRLSAMVIRWGLALNLRTPSHSPGWRLKMSTGPTPEDLTRNRDLQPASRPDRTWKRSNGISFCSPQRATWSPPQNQQTSSYEHLLNVSSAHCRGDQVKSSYQSDIISMAEKQDAPTSSQFVQEISTLALSSTCSQDDPLYPQLPVSAEAREASRPHTQDSVPDAKPNKHIDSLSPPDEPFRAPLGFHIPKATLQDALNATPPSPSAFWNYRLYQGPGGEYDKVKVHYCKNKEDTERVAQLFLEDGVIGFDIEWKVNASAGEGISKNVALVQVASERRVALFHLARFPNAEEPNDFVAPSFKKLMESPKITKVGVSIKGDCTRLRKFLDIHPRGLLELSHLYKLVKYSSGDARKINKVLVSLADQVQEHLQLPLWKGEVRSSDWSQDLNYEQVQYAASDSYAGFHLFHVLEAKRKALNPTPPRPAHAELNLPIRLADGHIVATVDNAVDAAEDPTEDFNLSSEISIEELARDVEIITIEDHSNDLATQPSSRSTPASSPNQKPISLPPSPELTIANEWVTQYKSSHTIQPATKPAELRAYALWHEQNLDVPTVAKVLRRPPLQNATVANYVGRAIQFESLPFRSDRIAELESYCSAYGTTGVNWKVIKRMGEARLR